MNDPRLDNRPDHSIPFAIYCGSFNSNKVKTKSFSKKNIFTIIRFQGVLFASGDVWHRNRRFSLRTLRKSSSKIAQSDWVSIQESDHYAISAKGWERFPSYRVFRNALTSPFAHFTRLLSSISLWMKGAKAPEFAGEAHHSIWGPSEIEIPFEMKRL